MLSRFTALTHATILTLLVFASACGDNNKVSHDAAPIDAAPDAFVDVAPGPVTQFLAGNGSDRELALTWTNPTDATLAGILVVQSDAAISFAPTDGSVFTAGQDLGGGQSVLSVALATTTTSTGDSLAVPRNFAAWAFDNLHHYSTIATTAGTDNRLGPQIATLSIDITTNAVTVTQQPPNLNIDATTVATFDAGTSTLALDLALRNNTPRVVFNLKSLTTAQNQGTQSGATFPVGVGVPSVYFGPNALDVGAVTDITDVTHRITLAGIDGTVNPITVTLSFVDAPMLFMGGIAADSSGSGLSSGGRDRTIQGGTALSPDMRIRYTGNIRSPVVTAEDLTTGATTQSSPLVVTTNAIGGVVGVVLSPDASKLYALVVEGAHANGGNGQGSLATGAVLVSIVELDRATLIENRRLVIFGSGSTGRSARRLTISPDGTKLAALITSIGGANELNELALVDAATLSGTRLVILDTAPDTNGPADMAAELTAWHGNTLFVGFNGHHVGNSRSGARAQELPIDVVDTTTFAVTKLQPTAGTGSCRCSGLEVVGDTLYFAGGGQSCGLPNTVRGGVVAFDLAHTNAQTQLLAGNVAGGISGFVVAPASGLWFASPYTDQTTARVFSLATNTELDMDGDGSNGITPMSLGVNNANSNPHSALVTAF